MTTYKVGDLITVNEPIKAYYSNYAGQPEQNLEPGTVARIVNPKVPTVRGPRRSFILVEFEGVLKNSTPETRTWRAAVYPEQIAGRVKA
jgi:hypothetical protein